MTEPASPPSAPPEAPPARPAQKKKTSSLTILLAVMGGILLLMGVVIVVAILVVFSSPEGRTMFGVVGEAVKISMKAQKAPGTKVLRGAGCKQAMVMNLDDLVQMMGRDAGPSAEEEQKPFGEMVVCTVNPWGKPPPCDELASTYVAAVGPRPESFAVTVQQAGKHQPSCSALYDGSGRMLRPIDSRTAPRVPE